MFTEYFQTAMRLAKYEILEDGTYFGHISKCRGTYANAKTLEKCRNELQSVLEDWVLLGLHFGHKIPVINGIDLNFKGPKEIHKPQGKEYSQSSRRRHK